MKKSTHHLIAEVPCRRSRVETTIGIDLGDVWSHYCKLNEDGEVVDRGRFRTTPKAVEKWFTDLPPARVAMEAGTHSIWISEQLEELGHEVIVAKDWSCVCIRCSRVPVMLSRDSRPLTRNGNRDGACADHRCFCSRRSIGRRSCRNRSRQENFLAMSEGGFANAAVRRY